MAIEEILEDMSFEAGKNKYQEEWYNKHKLAIQFGWNYTNFKRFISQFLKREYSEDQWVFDYESYVDTLKSDRYEHPANWAEFFYQQDWDIEKLNKSLINLKNIANNK